MANRWTKKHIEETDDLAFAILILSERGESLNQESPLSKKIFSVIKTLMELRDLCRERPELEPKEAIWRAAEYESTVDDIKDHLVMADDGEEDVNLHGMTSDTVLADKEIVAKIVDLVDAGSCKSDYWHVVENAIERGIKEVLDERAKELPE